MELVRAGLWPALFKLNRLRGSPQKKTEWDTGVGKTQPFAIVPLPCPTLHPGCWSAVDEHPTPCPPPNAHALAAPYPIDRTALATPW